MQEISFSIFQEHQRKVHMEIHMKICGEAAFVLMNDLSFIRCNIYLFLTQQETAAKPADRDPLAFECLALAKDPTSDREEDQ